ncbi:hypothetical protein GZ78_24830 [Endozoicomonas numazuensis]|uniref:Uncharacterized protein n=1 Tax=Endozoicomonas numazuensis TaxID=1137799 RepID=A0A081N9G8_9GAMM|nr:hypothetical protein GZ78_24830 [Endozoicomonas numazuensis]
MISGTEGSQPKKTEFHEEETSSEEVKQKPLPGQSDKSPPTLSDHSPDSSQNFGTPVLRVDIKPLPVSIIPAVFDLNNHPAQGVHA